MLDIIIVNYNVKYFLEQCLFAVQKAMLGIVGEIIVVDNASTDGSKDYLEKLFPTVRFIWMYENLGFAKANNIGLKYTKSKYVLYLNPDTIVPEDCFNICLNFMELHKNAGALGVKMIDGTGKFLRESKRAYPSIATSFFKLTGLSGLFPKSKLFAKYHLGHLDKNKNHQVEVLSGAFMLVRRELLLQIGGFDESFFMYVEDIELSLYHSKLNHKI
jgi:GT2 family glycosyltransferase